MTSAERNKLVRLKDTDETIAATDSDIRGRRVLDKDGNNLGTVDALLIDEHEQKVRFVEVATGGFLGMGKSKSLIPVEAITRIDYQEVHLNLTTDTVAGSPGYDPALVEDPGVFHDSYGYYGFLPYWGLGYVYPTYQYYSDQH
ncbi:MAG: PRC-barrel domain-containing protein [Actinomycetota bacterium]